jgi:ATP-dependent DNA helicase RecG
MSAIDPDSPVQFVKGIGPRRAQALATLEIHTVADLLGHFPFRYERDAGQVDIADLQPDLNVTIRGQVRRMGGRPPTLTCTVDDGTGTCVLRWFQRQTAPRGLHAGVGVIAQGTVREYRDQPELVQPRVRLCNVDDLPARVGTEAGLVGVYPATADLPSHLIRRAILGLLEATELPLVDVLPPELRRKHELPTRAAAVRTMHRPASEAALGPARRRLAYEELLLLELGMALRRYRQHDTSPAQRLEVTPEIDARIRARFPFDLTADQRTAARSIAHDLERGTPMTRLLQGDVGTGKTVVALYACLAAIAHRRQAAIMAPTEILARQHLTRVEQYLSGSRVRHALLRGGMAAGERQQMLADIAAGRIDLVIGTHALIQHDVTFRDLGLVVIDEQHKFGVAQRQQFRTKGPQPHYLVMTATPIPRTLAMTIFGDLDVSVLRCAPPGRGTITTRIVPAGQRTRVLRKIAARLAAGEQAYVVCPQIGRDDADEDVDTDPVATVRRVHQELSETLWPELDIGMLHGCMTPDEKDATIVAFARGHLHAVVATTVVEVGVDVPGATIMIVENADRYGLSQLHQLRGRVGRGTRDSTCLLIAGAGSPKARERLGILEQTIDGFAIAEADLRLRGPGELLGTRQHGLPELLVADLTTDFKLLQQARDDAFELIARDPRLEQDAHRALRAALPATLAQKVPLIETG